jgi:uncharacterized protein YecE (DUF72 family)
MAATAGMAGKYDRQVKSNIGKEIEVTPGVKNCLLGTRRPYTEFFLGTSGLLVPIPRSQYPEAFQGKSRLCYYSSLFNSLEVNSSFYKSPRPATVANWAAEVGNDFRFTFKMPKTISHAKELGFDPAEVSAFIKLVNNVGDKKGCLLIQLPPALTSEATKQLKQLLTTIKKYDAEDAWHIAVEFRHNSWYAEKTYKLLEQFNTCIVIHDLPRSKTPLPVTGNFYYLRFHGDEGRYRGSYELQVLQEYAKSIKGWLSSGKDVYCYFNNTMGDAFANAKTLEALAGN